MDFFFLYHINYRCYFRRLEILRRYRRWGYWVRWGHRHYHSLHFRLGGVDLIFILARLIQECNFH
jgi:hypothetical protein